MKPTGLPVSQMDVAELRVFVGELQARNSQLFGALMAMASEHKCGVDQYIDMPAPQLVAARFAFHAVRKTNYRDAVERHELTDEQAGEKYRLAMENYDGIVANGGNVDAMLADMERGFDG